METRLRFGDRTLTVTLEGVPEVRAARVDETPVALAAWRALGRSSAGAFDVHDLVLDVDGGSRRVLVARRGDRLLVALAGDGRVYELALADAADGASAHSAHPGAVTAPMPGKVVSVLVAEGDAVEAGQAVVVLEAMKMETSVTTPGAGTVSAVRVAAGDTVDAGAVLVDVS